MFSGTITVSNSLVLIALANQAAIAIENAELDLRVRSAEEALTTRKLIERAKDILSQEDGP
jgi:AmiR/NasT family two-component response regulator